MANLFDKIPNVICSIIISYAISNISDWASLHFVSKFYNTCCKSRLAYEHLILNIDSRRSHHTLFIKNCIQYLPFIIKINIDAARISIRSMNLISTSFHLISLTIIQDFNMKKDYQWLSNLLDLENLTLISCYNIKNYHLNLLMSKLKYLSINDSPYLFDVHYERFENIHTLHIIDMHMDDSHFSSISKMPSLHNLFLSNIKYPWNYIGNEHKFNLDQLIISGTNNYTYRRRCILSVISGSIQSLILSNCNYVKLTLPLLSNLNSITIHDCSSIDDYDIVYLIKRFPFLNVTIS